MPIRKEMGSSLCKASLAFRHNKVNPSLRLLQRELNTNPEWFAFSHQSLLVRFAGDPDVEFSTIEIRVDQVAAGEMVFAEGVQVPFSTSAWHTSRVGSKYWNGASTFSFKHTYRQGMVIMVVLLESIKIQTR